MPSFAIRHPYLIIVFCLFVCVLGITSVVQMPVDMFPPINIPVVLVATFYSGMPPQQIEADITDTFERFFTLASGVDHMESRSMAGVSLIKIYFQPGTDANADVTQISNLAMADLRRLPEGTLPPVVMKVDASSLPVCLLTVEGQGLNETQLHDYLQYQIRNQIAGVPGATVPPPYGGKYRQLMVYVDPLKLQAHELSPMDVVRATNASNLILPAGDVRIGPMDYNIYTNAQVARRASAQRHSAQDRRAEIRVRLRRGQSRGRLVPAIQHRPRGWAEIGLRGRSEAGRRHQHHRGGQRNPKRHQDSSRHSRATEDQRGLRSIGLRQGGDFHGAARRRHRHLSHRHHDPGFPGKLPGHGGGFSLDSALGDDYVFRAAPDGQVDQRMVLSGLALAFSRLIDDSVVVIENIYRHLEMGEEPRVAAEKGANEVALAVLAIMLVAVVVFFPVTFLFGVSKFLFTALALGVVIALFASYFDAVTVVPLFCANFLKAIAGRRGPRRASQPVLGSAIPRRVQRQIRSAC